MLVETLPVTQIPQSQFAIKDHWLCSCAPNPDQKSFSIKIQNLVTRERKTLCHCYGRSAEITVVNDSFYLTIQDKSCECFKGRVDFEAGKLKLERNVSHMNANACVMWKSKSILYNLDQKTFLCLENERIYTCPLIDRKNPVFTHNNRLFHVSNKNDRIILKSFDLQNQRQIDQVQLVALNDVSGLFDKWNVSCVFGNEVRIVTTHDDYLLFYRIDLLKSTIEDITDLFDDLSLQNVKIVTQTDSAMFLLGRNQNEVDVLCKLKVMKRCEPRFSCFTCQKSMSKDESFQCGQCRVDTAFLICARCVAFEHLAHKNVTKVDFVDLKTKKAKISTLEKPETVAMDYGLCEQLAKSLTRTYMRINQLVDDRARAEEKIRRNDLLSIEEFDEKLEEIRVMNEKVEKESNAIETWKARINGLIVEFGRTNE